MLLQIPQSAAFWDASLASVASVFGVFAADLNPRRYGFAV